VARAIGLTFGVAMAASVGCSLLVETSGLSGDVTPLSSEAGAGDATPGTDAGTDAPGTKTDAAIACDATFCDGFDDGPIGARWDIKEPPVAATLALVPGTLSAPWALELDLPQRAPASFERMAFLAKSFHLTAGTVSCRFSVNVVLPPAANGDFALFQIDPSPVSDNHVFEMKVVNDGSLEMRERYDADGGGVEIKNTFGTPPAGQWVSIALAADFNAHTLTATLNSAPSKTFSMVAPAGVTSVKLSLGETGDSDSAHFTARFDDFACSVP
jgi:hypothetical protein